MSRKDEIICLNRLKSAFFNNPTNTIVFDNTGGYIQKALKTCRPNPVENAFPDFIFGSAGALEHFLIGSAKEGRKGSEFSRSQREESGLSANYVHRKAEAYLASPFEPRSSRMAIYETCYDGFSYKEFLKSLERNCSNHLASLRNSRSDFQTVVFLMEQQTPRLCVYEGGVFSRFYLLSADRNALKILAKYAHPVRYIVYFSCDAVEAIDLSKLQEMLVTAEEPTDIRGGRLVKEDLLFFLDL